MGILKQMENGILVRKFSMGLILVSCHFYCILAIFDGWHLFSLSSFHKIFYLILYELEWNIAILET